MLDLQQRVLDNLLSDVLIATFIVVLAVFGLYRLGKFWRVSILPMTVLTPTFILVGLLLYLPLSPVYLRSDGEYYQRWGFSLAESWISGAPIDGWPPLWPGKGVWPLIIGGLSVIAGPATIALIVFNALLLVLSAVLLQKATLLLGGRSPRWTLIIVFLSSSPFLLWGPSLLREALFWVGVALGVLALSFAASNLYISSLSVSALSVVILLGIRPDAGVVIAYGFVATSIFIVGIVGQKRLSARSLVSWLLLVALTLSFPTALKLLREDVSLDTIVRVQDSLSTGVTTAIETGWCGSSAIKDSVWTIALCTSFGNLPYALFGPFHWEYGPEAIWFIAGVSTLHFLVLVALAGYHIATSKGRRWPSVAILAVAAGSMLMFSSILTNYGILIRFRAATEIMLIPLAILGALSLMSKINSSRLKRSVSDSSEGSYNP